MQTATPTDAAPAKRRRMRPLLWIGGFVGAVIAAFAVFYFYTGWARERELEALFAEIDADDPHWRWPDMLAQRPLPPDDENAFVQIRKVNTLLKRKPYMPGMKWDSAATQNALNIRNARLSRDNMKTLDDAFLALDATVIAEARKLKDLPKGRVAIDPSVSPLMLKMDEVQQVREIYNLLSGDVIRSAQQGQRHEAAQSCQALLNTTHAIGDHPGLIAQLVRFAGRAISIAAVERLLAQGELDDADLVRLQTMLQREADDNSLYHGLRGERAWGHEIYVDLSTGRRGMSELLGPMGTGSGFTDRLIDMFPNVILSGYPDYLRSLNEMVQATKLKDEKRAAAFAEIDKKSRASNNMLTRMLLPATSKVAEADQRTQAQLRCAIAALAAERFRMSKQYWPRDVDELVKAGFLKEAPLDPYDGKPLRMKRTATGLLLYSISKDKTDDGGKLDRINMVGPNTDLGFELWDKAARGGPPPADGDAAR